MNEDLNTQISQILDDAKTIIDNQNKILATVPNNEVLKNELASKVNNDDFKPILDAMNLHFNQKSFEDDGYTKLPNGLIFQWGILKGVSGSTQLFPIAFPTKVLCIMTEADENGSNNRDLTAIYKNSITNAGFKFSKYFADAPGVYSADGYFFAIGY